MSDTTGASHQRVRGVIPQQSSGDHLGAFVFIGVHLSMTIAAAGSIAAAGAIAERNPRRLAARPNASHGLTVCSASAGPDDRRCGSAKMGQVEAKAGRLTAVAMTAAAAPISPAFAAAASQEVAQARPRHACSRGPVLHPGWRGNQSTTTRNQSSCEEDPSLLSSRASCPSKRRDRRRPSTRRVERSS